MNVPPTKESGSGEAVALASNLTYEPTPDEIQRASDLILDLVTERDALVLVAEAVVNGEWEAARELSDAALERTP